MEAIGAVVELSRTSWGVFGSRWSLIVWMELGELRKARGCALGFAVAIDFRCHCVYADELLMNDSASYVFR